VISEILNGDVETYDAYWDTAYLMHQFRPRIGAIIYSEIITFYSFSFGAYEIAPFKYLKLYSRTV